MSTLRASLPPPNDFTMQANHLERFTTTTTTPTGADG
jgi:hypothetical protein